MKKQKREYPDEFKEQVINLLLTTDRPASDIERELGITQGLLSRWNRQKAAAEGTPIAPRAKRPLQGDESLADLLRQMKQEHARLRQEKDILKKAVAIFTHPNQ
jgi:transposase